QFRPHISRGLLQPLGTSLVTPPGSPPGASTVLIPIVRVPSPKPIPIHPLHADSFPFHFHHHHHASSLFSGFSLSEGRSYCIIRPLPSFYTYILLFADKLVVAKWIRLRR